MACFAALLGPLSLCADHLRATDRLLLPAHALEREALAVRDRLKCCACVGSIGFGEHTKHLLCKAQSRQVRRFLFVRIAGDYCRIVCGKFRWGPYRLTSASDLQKRAQQRESFGFGEWHTDAAEFAERTLTSALAAENRRLGGGPWSWDAQRKQLTPTPKVRRPPLGHFCSLPRAIGHPRAGRLKKAARYPLTCLSPRGGTRSIYERCAPALKSWWSRACWRCEKQGGFTLRRRAGGGAGRGSWLAISVFFAFASLFRVLL